ncbi:MAG: HAD family hydrolase [Ruminococcaceae bacterium]|nr:HAD family hydrolase [Oscillospiraceae bacterium]
MDIKVVLFDLDGTLLPMDQEEFVRAYFGLLSQKMSHYGYNPKELVSAIWQGTKAMMKNDGTHLNEEVFWRVLKDIYGDRILESQPYFEEFYHNEFIGVKDICSFNPLAKEAVDRIKNKGLRIALATQPIFPHIATQNRIKWAGLEESDFELVTYYENIGFSKPSLEYYKEVCKRLNVDPTECLMVGNDVDDDMIVSSLGMKTFLLTDCLINNSDKDISLYHQGTFNDLMNYLNV